MIGLIDVRRAHVAQLQMLESADAEIAASVVEKNTLMKASHLSKSAVYRHCAAMVGKLIDETAGGVTHEHR
jgi:hypothetical protein